jgi:hypothetical protein
MRRLTVSLLAATCLLAVAACGGGGTKAVDANLYTGAVCRTLNTWQQHLESASAVLARTTNTATSLRDVRTQFVTFFGGAIDETDNLLVEVEEAGVPDVNDGERVAASLLQSLRRFRPILVEARAEARQLPLGDEAVFAPKAQQLGNAFGVERTKLATLWETLGKRHHAPELTRAANADAACRNP